MRTLVVDKLSGAAFRPFVAIRLTLLPI